MTLFLHVIILPSIFLPSNAKREMQKKKQEDYNFLCSYFHQKLNSMVRGKMRHLKIWKSKFAELISIWHYNWYDWKNLYREIITNSFKVTSINLSKVQALFYKSLDYLILRILLIRVPKVPFRVFDKLKNEI